MADQPDDKNNGFEKLLQEVNKTLQENQRFLVALKQDRLTDDELDTELAEVHDGEEEFEEL